MKRFTVKAVLLLGLASFVLGASFGCGKKAPPVPPDEPAASLVRAAEEGRG